MENYADRQKVLPCCCSRHNRTWTHNWCYANFVCIVSPLLTVAIRKYPTDFHCCWVLGCCFLSFWHLDPPLSHLPGAVWSHTVTFPHLAAVTAGTQHNQWWEEGLSAGTVITVTARGALLRDSRWEGGGNHLTPSVSCGFPHRAHSPNLFSFPIFPSTSSLGN